MGQVNGEAAILLRSEDSEVNGVLLFHFEEEKIHNIYIVETPTSWGISSSVRTEHQSSKKVIATICGYDFFA